MRVRTFFLMFLSIVPQELPACIWCTNRPIPVLQLFEKESRKQLHESPLFRSKDGDGERLPEQLPSFLHWHDEYGRAFENRFYTEYLSVYYPRAEAMRDILFPMMCPTAAAEALAALFYLIHERTWFYFMSTGSNAALRRVHVSILYEQLRILVEGVRRMVVDQYTGLIQLTDQVQGRNVRSLIALWQASGNFNVYADFCALYIDVIVRMCWIAMRFEEYAESYICHERLQRTLLFLEGTQYESLYSQVTRLYAELLKMLRQRRWGSV